MCVDYEPSQVWRETERKARTSHRCCECARTIEPGETYRHIDSLEDGNWWAYKQCAHCVELTRWLQDVCRGWAANIVREDFCEHWEEDTVYRSVPMGRLVIWSGRRWKRNGELVPVENVRTWVDASLAHTRRLEASAWGS